MTQDWCPMARTRSATLPASDLTRGLDGLSQSAPPEHCALLTPADADHRFGHGKAEALAGLTQPGFIAASGCALLVAIVERLGNPKQVREEEIGLFVSTLRTVDNLRVFVGNAFRRRRGVVEFVFAVGLERRCDGFGLFFLEHRGDDVDALLLHFGFVRRTRDVDADGHHDLGVQLDLDVDQAERLDRAAQ